VRRVIWASSFFLVSGTYEAQWRSHFPWLEKISKNIDSLTIQNRTKKQKEIKKNKTGIGRKTEAK